MAPLRPAAMASAAAMPRRGRRATPSAMGRLSLRGMVVAWLGRGRRVSCDGLGRFRCGHGGRSWSADLLLRCAARQEDEVSDKTFSPLISARCHGNNLGLLVQSGKI